MRQLLFLLSAQPLDPHLFQKCQLEIPVSFTPDQFYGPSVPGVFGPAPRVVELDPVRQVVRAPGIIGPVGALQYINEKSSFTPEFSLH